MKNQVAQRMESDIETDEFIGTFRGSVSVFRVFSGFLGFSLGGKSLRKWGDSMGLDEDIGYIKTTYNGHIVRSTLGFSVFGVDALRV